MKRSFTLSLARALFGVLFIAFHTCVRAQEIPVTFKIVNSKKEPVVFATVNVVKRTDSLKKETKISDSGGLVSFNLAKGQYIITVSSVNYQPLEKGITVTPVQRSFTFTLEDLPKTLSGVVVTSSRPLMRQEDDKTILDP